MKRRTVFKNIGLGIVSFVVSKTLLIKSHFLSEEKKKPTKNSVSISIHPQAVRRTSRHS